MSAAQDAAQKAVAAIHDARKSGIALNSLPAGAIPGNATEGYAIQRALHDLWPIAGWKIGCTTKPMQDALGIDHPCAGGTPADMVFHGHAALDPADFIRPGAELEIGVRLGRDVPKSDTPYTRATIKPFVKSTLAAIEIVDDRYVDHHSVGLGSLIANDFFGRGAIYGEDVVELETDLADLEGVLTVNGEEHGRGSGAEVMGHPLEALAWLANLAKAEDFALKADDIVLMGAIVKVHWLQPGDRVEGSVSGLGSLRLTYGV